MNYSAAVWRAVVRRMLETTGMTMTAFEEAAGISQNTLAKFLRGQQKGMTLNRVSVLATAAKWSRGKLIYEVEKANIELEIMKNVR